MSLSDRLGNKSIHRDWPAKTLSRKFLWILLTSLSVMAFVLAPGIMLFVINHEQKQCALMWVGDESVRYQPPEPWQVAGPDKNGLFQTQLGSCNLKKVDHGEIDYEECCQKIGYSFIGTIEGVVSYRNYGLYIGFYIFLLFDFIYTYWLPIAIFLVIVYFLKKRFKKNANEQKTTGEQNGS
jgi:hypothetical protein